MQPEAPGADDHQHQHHRRHDAAQWIQNEDVTGDGVTDYIYGELDRNVVAAAAWR
jgi:hypothetical protein